MQFRELDIVALAVDLPEHGLAKDDLGTVVHVHRDGAAYEVEFVEVGGRTIGVVTLPATALAHVDETSMLTARSRPPEVVTH